MTVTIDIWTILYVVSFFWNLFILVSIHKLEENDLELGALAFTILLSLVPIGNWVISFVMTIFFVANIMESPTVKSIMSIKVGRYSKPKPQDDNWG